MNADRALEIIAGHGGDEARWPQAERAGLAALAVRDPAVAAALASARELDGLLDAWAIDVIPCEFDATALQGAAARPRPPLLRQARTWVAGAGLAVAMATGFAVLAPSSTMAPAPTAAGSTAGAASAAPASGPVRQGDAEAFALLFTPTADEDDLI